MSVSVTFLGGLGEIGRNCAALEVEGKIALIDVGLMFPEEDMLGVDLVLPDFSYVTERADSVEAVEFATLAWVDWFNMRRLLGPIGDIPPAEFPANRPQLGHGQHPPADIHRPQQRDHMPHGRYSSG